MPFFNSLYSCPLRKWQYRKKHPALSGRRRMNYKHSPWDHYVEFAFST